MLRKPSKILYVVLIALNVSAYGMENNKRRKFEISEKWESEKKEKLSENAELTAWATLPIELKSYIFAFTRRR